MFTKIKKVIVVFCSGALVLAAAGCTGEANPAEPTNSSPTSTATVSAPPPTVSPSPTAKPTPKPIPGTSKGPAKYWPVPKMPDAAKKNSDAGVAAFTKYWFDVLEYMYITNDSRPLKAITRPACDLCARKFIDPADGLAKNGAWSVGGALDTTVTLSVTEGDSAGVANFQLEQEELLVYSKNGEYYGKLPGTKKPDAGTLVLIFDEGWHVIDLQWLDAS
ncbi:DUF6318 family protein [Paeniglutamicibacter sp. MACA_103]|uniref:DUF6318 family protein n=1 Tax=Paeniglutamicibacter sp. MACA_103 TaxID=3377337 RepID=UPI003895FF09